MKILDEKSNLGALLGEYQDRDISIVTAFASGTESNIDLLIRNNNRVTVIVGTINAYSSPSFIRYCANKKNKNFSFSVDFRRESSIHWKLYLVSPNVIIIGSANFTKLGLSLERDTCVKIEEKSLYLKYLKKFSRLLNRSGVVSSTHEGFEGLFSEYINVHKEQQRSRNRTTSSLSIRKWLESEENQTVPLLIWGRNHTREARKKAFELLRAKIVDSKKKDVRDFFTIECDYGMLPYSQGDVVLTSKYNGQYLMWHTLDAILFRNGVYYLYSLKRPDKRYYRPFSLRQVKDILIKQMPVWDERQVTELTRKDLEGILRDL